MKTKYKTAEALAGKSLLDLKKAWETFSDPHKGVEYQYTRQHASRAATWLTLAMSDLSFQPGSLVAPEKLQELQASVPLDRVLTVDPEKVGLQARAIFLISVHSLPTKVAYDWGPGQNLSLQARKSANNTKESVVRAVRFFQTIFASRYGMEETGSWPAAVGQIQYGQGMTLYRAIQRTHVQENVVDPHLASPKLALKAAQKYIDRATSRKNAGPYHTMRKQLLEALENDLLVPLSPSLLNELPVLTFDAWRGEKATLARVDVVGLWPAHFALDPIKPTRLDYQFGLLGFYNKECDGPRPLNPAGNKCPASNLLGGISMIKREEAIRRFLYRARLGEGTQKPKALEDYFAGECLISWMDRLLSDTGTITVHHKSEHLDIAYVATRYFGQNIEAYDEWLDEAGVDFPDSGECMRGSKAVDLAGSPAVFLEWAQAFALYASAPRRLSAGKASGFFLPRKSCQIDVLMRAETGLRPGNLDTIEFRMNPPDRNEALPCPTLWKQSPNSYLLAIPYRCMKQHKKRLSGHSKWKTKQKCYQFPLELDETVQALDQYIEFGWKHAAGISDGTSTRLYLSRTGMPLPSLQGSFLSMRAKAAETYQRATGTSLPLLDRYSARHVVGEFLNRYMPGGQLKAWYLTHRSGIGSDNSYGDDDAQFLRKCIHDVLRGLPSLPDQQRQRDEDRLKSDQQHSEMLQDLLNQTMEGDKKINSLLALLERKDEEIRNLRGKSALRR